MAKRRKSASSEIDLRRAESLVIQLLAIPGPSCQEAEVAGFIETALRRAGARKSWIVYDRAHRKSRFGGEVGNLILTVPGTVKGPRRLLSAHIDTVPLCVGCRPEVRGRRVSSAVSTTALGADNRSGVAAILLAALDIIDRDLPHPPLTFLWPVQEEIGLVGSTHLDCGKLRNPELGFNFDGGKPGEVVIGAIGASRLEIDVHGVASHAGVHPERGVSSIAVAAKAIADLDGNGWHGLVRKGRQSGTSNVGVIEAGQATNVVTDYARLGAEARSHNPNFRDRIVDAYRKAFSRAARTSKNDAGKSARVGFHVEKAYESFVIKKTEACVRILEEAIANAGEAVTHRVVNGGLDANLLNAHGIPTVSLGGGACDPHTVKESLDLRQFFTACRIARRLATVGAE